MSHSGHPPEFQPTSSAFRPGTVATGGARHSMAPLRPTAFPRQADWTDQYQPERDEST